MAEILKPIGLEMGKIMTGLSQSGIKCLHKEVQGSVIDASISTGSL